MSDLTPKPASGRGLRLALAVSVALNLGFVGMIGGAMLRLDGPRGHSMPRDLRRLFMEASPGFGQQRRAVDEELTPILAALRADPFNPTALDAAMKAQVTRLSERMDLGKTLLLDFLSDLSAPDRHAFADRLEASAARGAPKHRPEAGN